jgi:hypothetical protein
VRGARAGALNGWGKIGSPLFAAVLAVSSGGGSLQNEGAYRGLDASDLGKRPLSDGDPALRRCALVEQRADLNLILSLARFCEPLSQRCRLELSIVQLSKRLRATRLRINAIDTGLFRLAKDDRRPSHLRQERGERVLPLDAVALGENELEPVAVVDRLADLSTSGDDLDGGNRPPVGLPGLGSLDRDRIRRILIRNIGQPIVWTDDGTTPTTTHGIAALTDEVLIYDGADFNDFEMVRRTYCNP